MAFNMITGHLSPLSCQVATGETVTAGDFVKSMSSTDVVTSSGVSSYATSDILVGPCDASGDENLCIGIAGSDGSAGDTIPVHTTGLFIVKTNAAITTGNVVQKADTTDAQEIDDYVTGDEDELIGRALTGASAADKYIILLLRA